ncbi:hypothetical protein KI387_044453, partial [Taxus chinensis]
LEHNTHPDVHDWMKEMITFLSEGTYPPGLSKEKRRCLRLQSIPYVLIDGILFKKNLDGVLL